MLMNRKGSKALSLLAMVLVLAMLTVACSGNAGNNSGNNAANNGGNSNQSGAQSMNGSTEGDGIQIELGKNGPVEIDFWHIQATIYGEAIKEMVADFNKQYEGKIIVNEVFQGSYSDLNQKLRAALQGGGLPAVAMAGESDILQYMKADQIVALDEYIEDPTYGLTEAEVNDILPAVLERQRISAYEGKTMSWPHGNSSLGIYYNKDILAEAGYDAPAKTWKEFEQQALDIYEKTGIPALVIGNGQGYGSHSWSFLTSLGTYGVDPIKPDLSGVDLDNAHALELLTIFKNLLNAKAILVGEDTEQEFTNARAAMELGTTARTTSKQDLIQDQFEWGITLPPQGDPSTPYTSLGGGNQVLFKTTPEEQLAGWLFLKYFAGPEGQAIYGARTGYFPASLSAQDVEVLSKDYEEHPQKKQAFEEIFPAGKPSVATAASGMINDAVNNAILNVYAGKASPADALKSLQAEAAKLLEENK